ncbi:MAG: helix-turn-helix transcriptional regulator [Thermoanaerobaculia bacterium]
MAELVDRYAPARRLHQLKALLNSSGGVTVYDIADRLRVSVKTATRYLKALEAAGEPLYEETVARRKVWRLRASARHETITLTTSQMIALFLSGRVFDFLKGTGFKEDLDDVFARLEATLKRKDFVAARNLDRKIFDVNEAPHIYAERLEDVNDITTALVREERLRVRHDSVGRGQKEFVVEPYTILIYKKGLYLVANSPYHGARRTFALDGFRSVEWLKGDRFDYPMDYQPSQVAEGAFGLIRGELQHVRIFFDERVTRFVRRRQWHPTQRIRNVSGGIELTMDVAGTLEIANWILGFGQNATVLEPAALREQIAAELRAAADRYGSN